MRGKTGALGKDGDARVAGRKPLPADEPHDLGEQFHAVCACKPRVRVGEIVPDVPQSRRRKEGVHQRVYEDVAVRMRREPVRVRDDGAAQHDAIALAEGVRIDAQTDALGGCEVLGEGQFFIGAVADEQTGRRNVRRIHAALVGELRLAPFGEHGFVCPQQFAAQKTLRRLHGKDVPARGDGGDAAVFGEHRRIRRGKGAYAAAERPDACDAVLDELVRDVRARRVVDEHDLALRLAQGVKDALRARLPAGDGAGVGIGGKQPSDALRILGAAGDEDLVRGGGKSRDGIREDGHPVQFPQHFVLRKSRAFAPARRAEDGTDHAMTS